MYVAAYLSQKSIGNPRSIPGSQALSDTLFLFFLFLGLELQYSFLFYKPSTPVPTTLPLSPRALPHSPYLQPGKPLLRLQIQTRNFAPTSLVEPALFPPFSLPSRLSISAPRSSIPSQPHRCKNIPAPRSLDRCGREDCWGGGKGLRGFQSLGGFEVLNGFMISQLVGKAGYMLDSFGLFFR